MSSKPEAQMDLLEKSVYPGRGIAIGMTPDANHLVQVYWIMGRSPSSRNRVFVEEDGFVKTDTVDKSVPVDPLTMYYPAKSIGNCHIVTNGDQTDTVYVAIQLGSTFESALDTRTFEPDKPNYTPRISGVVDLDHKVNAYQLAVLKTIAHNPAYCTRHYFNYEVAIPGIGHCITTYPDDGNPLPSFSGEPLVVSMLNGLEVTRDLYWNALNEENRVSLMVKFINVSSRESQLTIVNKYSSQ